MSHPARLCPTARVIAATVAMVLSAGAASALTFQVFDTGDDTLLGSFEADVLGGQVSSPSFFVSGVTFDLIDPTDVPEYRADFNDLTGPGGTIFANFSNSVAAGGCNAGACGLFFEKINPGPPDAFIYNALNNETFENLDGGSYRIAPIPLPASGLLFMGALIATALWRGLARGTSRTARTA